MIIAFALGCRAVQLLCCVWHPGPVRAPLGVGRTRNHQPGDSPWGQLEAAPVLCIRNLPGHRHGLLSRQEGKPAIQGQDHDCLWTALLASTRSHRITDGWWFGASLPVQPPYIMQVLTRVWIRKVHIFVDLKVKVESELCCFYLYLEKKKITNFSVAIVMSNLSERLIIS